jgi:predicted TIM-barrel fold metal-dependent hydrolase
MAESLEARKRSGRRETLADLYVVDADVHVHEQPAELAEYADPPWDVALREIAKVEERYLDLPAMSPRAEYRIPWPGGSNRPQVVETAGTMRRELDDLHVNEAVLFPDHLLSLAMVREPAFAVALARAYNEWLADRWLRHEPTLRGAIVIPPQDPRAGAAEIRRHAGNPGYVCAYLPASGLKVLYGHELYDPVYDAAQEAGLPVAIHSVEAVYPVFPFQLEQFRTALAVHSLAHPLAMVANLVSMLETGVPVRFPALKVAFMEAGTGWVPWLANRLDKEYTERRREVPLLQERPSHYMRRFRYGTQPIEEPERRSDVVRLYELFNGEHTAMFASDWPHHDFDHTQHVFGLPFPPEARRRIMGVNAAEFFALDSPA